MNKPKAYIGVDPGQTGATVLISDDGIDFLDWPGDPVQYAKELSQWKNDFDIVVAMIEKIHSMPKQGVSSTFKFGCNFGMIQGVLSALKIPFMLFTPQQWQKGLISKSDGMDAKERSLTVARRMFPGVDWLSRKKDHNRADALLMAHQIKRGI